MHDFTSSPSGRLKGRSGGLILWGQTVVATGLPDRAPGSRGGNWDWTSRAPFTVSVRRSSGRAPKRVQVCHC